MKLKLENVSYKYNYSDKFIFNDLNAEFCSGNLYIVYGDSGSGKTTLLSLISQLDTVCSGNILIDGNSVYSYNINDYRLNTVSTIFQDFLLFPLLTVIENVSFQLELHGVTKPEAYKTSSNILNELNLSSALFNKFPASLSGGEQQRVSIARALISDAKIILAGEAVNNLDKDNAKTVLDKLFFLAKQQDKIVILVTHDKTLFHLADVVFLIEDLDIN